MKLIFNSLIAVFLAALLAGCSQDSANSLDQNKVTPYLAPDSHFQDLNGKTWKMSELKGKPVLINFWATWCPPCREEIPSMNRAWSKLKDEGVMMLAINVAEPDEAILEFNQKIPINFPVLLDPEARNSMAWGASGLPMTFILDTDGRVVYKVIGTREWDAKGILDTILALKK